MSDHDKPDDADVIPMRPQAPSPIVCEKCQQRIATGETYCLVRTPDGEAPVHHGCMGGRPL